MASASWDFWKLTNPQSGDLEWLAVTRRSPRSAIDRQKVWTLIPGLRIFIANWFVSEDRANGLGQWVHENVDVMEACDIVGDVPEPLKADIDRILRPQAFLTLDQIDRFPMATPMGKRAETKLRKRK